MDHLTEVQQERLVVADNLQRQALLFDKGKRHAEAERLYQQALAFHEDVFGSQHPALLETLERLAFFYGCQGRHEESEQCIQRALEVMEANPGPKHRGILQTLDFLVRWHYERRRYKEAERYCQRVLTVRQRLLGSNHPRVTATQEQCVLLRDKMNAPEASAERVGAEEAVIRTKIFGEFSHEQ